MWHVLQTYRKISSFDLEFPVGILFSMGGLFIINDVFFESTCISGTYTERVEEKSTRFKEST